MVIAVTHTRIVLANVAVIASALADLTSELAIPSLRVFALNELGLVNTCDDLGDNVVLV